MASSSDSPRPAQKSSMVLHINQCFESFDKLCSGIQSLGDPSSSQVRLADVIDERGRFEVWAADVSTHCKGLHGLDDKLQDAWHIRDTVMGLLADIQDALQDALEIVQGAKTPWDELSDSDSDSDSNSGPSSVLEATLHNETESQQLMSGIVDAITCLLRLSITIRNAAPHDQFMQPSKTNVSLFEKYDIDHVRSKFPRGEEYLVVRLGRAISRRRQYLKYREECYKSRAHSLATLDARPEETDHQSVQTSLPVALRTSDNRDLNKDVLSQTSYASTSTTLAPLSVPPLPREGKNQNLFECPYCFMTISVPSAYSWRAHVYRDLQPYVCSFEDCTTPDRLYVKRHEWFSHELAVHRRRWHCFQDCDVDFPSETTFRDHLQSEHPQIATRIKSPLLVRMCEERARDGDKVDCALCGEVLFSLLDLRRHLGRHHEQLALFALPVSQLSEDAIGEEGRKVEVVKMGSREQYDNDLQKAAFDGQEHAVRLLLEAGADVIAPGKSHGRALQAAAIRGHEAVVRLLLETGADVDAQSGYYGTALQAAASRGHEAIVQLLLEAGADVNAQSESYGTALQAAASPGHEEIVRLLLEAGADVNAKSEDSGYALHAAAIRGHEAIVRLLLETGADVDAQSGYYGTALQAAASGGRGAVLRLLLKAGADVNTQSGNRSPALQAAASGGYADIVQLLLEAGADVNVQSGYSGTALQVAASRGHEAVVRRLLEAGADSNTQSGHHGTALEAAAFEGHEAIVQLLLETGADVDAQSEHSGGALQLAALYGHEVVVRLLLEKGADVNASGYHGTALQAAASEGRVAVLRLLLEAGADVNAQGGGRSPALHAAASRGYADIVQLLLEAGADVNVRSEFYGNALEAAAFEGHEAIMRLLLDAMIDSNL